MKDAPHRTLAEWTFMVVCILAGIALYQRFAGHPLSFDPAPAPTVTLAPAANLEAEPKRLPALTQLSRTTAARTEAPAVASPPSTPVPACMGYWIASNYGVSLVQGDHGVEVAMWFQTVGYNYSNPISMPAEASDQDLGAGTGSYWGNRLTGTFGNIESVDLTCKGDRAIDEAGGVLHRTDKHAFERAVAKWPHS